MSKSWLKLQFIRKPGGFYRTLVVDTKVEEDLEVPKRKYVRKKPLESKASKDLLTYFSTPERENVLTSYPQQLYRKKSGIPEGLYNTSPKTARIIVDHLKKDLLPDRQLLELFPGQGHITKLLANETTNQLLLYEPEKDFLRGLTVSQFF